MYILFFLKKSVALNEFWWLLNSQFFLSLLWLFNFRGTMEGDILVLHSSSMWVHTVVKKAHLGILTSLMFSHDSRFLYDFIASSKINIVKKYAPTTWELRLIVESVWFIYRALLSSSFDSSARVTLIEEKEERGMYTLTTFQL